MERFVAKNPSSRRSHDNTMSGRIITTIRICIILGLLAIAGCTNPHPASDAARNGIDSTLLTGTWGELDTGAAFTFAADGTFRMTMGGVNGATRKGTYKIAGPHAAILTFQPIVPGSSPEQLKYYYVILTNGMHLVSVESFILNLIPKAQK
jgi:hypothetical protein